MNACQLLQPLPLFSIAFIFGRKTRHKTIVVAVKIIDVIIMNARVTCSDNRFARTTTLTDVITAPYTENPIYCESLRAGIFTCLVSQAM